MPVLARINISNLANLSTSQVSKDQSNDGLRIAAQNIDRTAEPGVALWWLQDGHQPTLQDAKRRVDHFAEFGESPYAFTVRSDFTADQSIAPTWHVKTLLRMADDALIHAQRISEWCGHGPILEEDMALANVALDYLGQTRALYSYVGKIEGLSRDENDIAYWRADYDFYNSALVELPNSSKYGQRDYAIAITKLFLHATWMQCALPGLRSSSDATLAAVAAKAIKENQYHAQHAGQWMCRLGDGTDESRERVINALNVVWPYTHEWFVDDVASSAAASAKLCGLRSTVRADWLIRVDSILGQAKLTRPADTDFMSSGKDGYHTESFSYLINEMQSIARQHPGASW